MRKAMFLAGAALAVTLAGCSSSDAGSTKREAGNWANEVEIVKLEMPGMPPEVQQSMKAMMASSGAVNYCLTPEEAKKDDLDSLLAEGPGNGGECKWTKKNINGKNVDVAGTCTQNGQSAELAMTGTIESKQSDMTITTKAQAPNGQPMEMVMRVKSKRTGACDTAAPAPAKAAS